MAKRVRDMGQSAIALTDHGQLSGAYEFHKTMTAAGIRPIIGYEAYVSTGAASLREPIYWGAPEQKRHDASRGAYTHLTLLAMGDAGIQELYRLHSRASREGMYHRPRIDKSWIMETSNLIVLSGCAGSELSTRVRLDQYDDAEAYIAQMKAALGDRFYIETMSHGIVDDGSDGFDEAGLNEMLFSLAEQFGVPVVATPDAHYVNREDAQVHDSFLCIQTKSKLSDPGRFKFTGDGFYLKSRSEMEELFDGATLDRTLEIAERVGMGDKMFSHVLRMPKLAESRPGSLRAAVLESDRLTDETDMDRVNHELSVIEQGGYEDYFLIKADAIKWAKSQQIAIVPARGSAGGSLVCYLTYITDVDPMPHGLLFERFLNPERVSLPDIDTDIEDTRRDDLLDYLREKHGADRVAQIMTLGTIGAKAALKDATRVLGHPYTLGEELVGTLPPALFGRQPELSDLPPVDGPIRRGIVALAQGLDGLVRSTGVHPAGVVVSPVPISEVMPTSWVKDTDVQITGFDAGPTEALGFVKMDFLGLRNLGILNRTVKRLGKDWQFLLDLPLDDLPTYQLLQSGHTEGVFQLDSDGMKRLLKDVKPSAFNDIAAVLALYRPGPMGARAHTEYAKRKAVGRGSLGIDLQLDRDLAPILDETYGLFVYQEQVMRSLQVAGGYSLGEADLLRKAMGKKDRALLGRLKPEFVSRVGSNYDTESAEALWHILEPFADYAFNRAHSVGYGMVSYWCAYLKAHHPVEYMAEVLTSVSDDPVRLPIYLEEVRRMGIRLLPPDVNVSEASYTPTKEGISMGLGGIKGFGESAHSKLEESRPYGSLDDFFKRAHSNLLNIGTLRALVRVGAFDSIEPRRVLLDGHAEILAGNASLSRKMAEQGYRPLIAKKFNLDGLTEVLESTDQYIEWETELLGIGLSFGKMSLYPARPLTADEWDWVGKLIAACPGESLVEVKIGDVMVDTGHRVNQVLVREKLQVVQHYFLFDTTPTDEDLPPWDL
jgi:DNA polymerase-3 subunit alpha